MVLIFGILGDPVMGFLSWRLASLNEPFLILDARVYRKQFDLSWEAGQDEVRGTLRFGDRKLDLRDVRSIYLHSIVLASHTHALRLDECPPPMLEACGSLTAFLDGAPLLVANRPSVSSSNASKTYQQQLIERHGFLTPRTLVTMEPDAVRDFYSECDSRVIYKSLSYKRSIVKLLRPADFQRIEAIRVCPTQFQEHVPGVDVRVHVVGRRCFPTEIRTEATDYRYAGIEGADRQMRPVDLPDEIADRCLKLARGIGMVVCGIDLRRTPDGRYYCLEVNPSPGFTFYQRYTGQRIGDALVDLLRTGEL